jgi:hypothetical protein
VAHTVTAQAPHFSWYSPIVLDPLKALVDVGGTIIKTVIDATVTISRWMIGLAKSLALQLGKDLLGIAPILRCGQGSKELGVTTSSLLGALTACTEVARGKDYTLRLRNGYAFPVRTEKLPTGVVLRMEDTWENGTDVANLVRNLFWMNNGQAVVGGASLGRATITPAMKTAATVKMELDSDAVAFDMAMAIMLAVAPETAALKAGVKAGMQSGIKQTTGWLKFTYQVLNCVHNGLHVAPQASVRIDPFSKASVEKQADIAHGCLDTILSSLNLDGSLADLIGTVKVFPATLQAMLYPIAVQLGEQLGLYKHTPPSAALRRTAVTPSFDGHWANHGLTLEITGESRGTLQWNAGPCTTSLSEQRFCAGNATIKFQRGSQGRLVGEYTKVWYVDEDGQTITDYESAGEDYQVGQGFWLAPNTDDSAGHTLIAGGGTADDPDGPGNPYLCDEYAMSHNGSTYQLCGA